MAAATVFSYAVFLGCDKYVQFSANQCPSFHYSFIYLATVASSRQCQTLGESLALLVVYVCGKLLTSLCFGRLLL